MLLILFNIFLRSKKTRIKFEINFTINWFVNVIRSNFKIWSWWKKSQLRAFILSYWLSNFIQAISNLQRFINAFTIILFFFLKIRIFFWFCCFLDCLRLTMLFASCELICVHTLNLICVLLFLLKKQNIKCSILIERI